MDDIIRQADSVRHEAFAKADRRLQRKWEKPVVMAIDGYTYDCARKAAKAEHMSTRRWIDFVITMAAFDVELGGHTSPQPE